MLNVLSVLDETHQDIFSQAQSLENTAIDFFQENMKLDVESYRLITNPCLSLINKRLQKHFNLEQMVLFPVIKNHSKGVMEIIPVLISEHNFVLERLTKFKIIENHKNSINSLRQLMNYLIEHAKKEDALLSTEWSDYEKYSINKLAETLSSYWPYAFK